MKTVNEVQRTALYIRVSTEEQALHGLSLDAQEAALREWARDNGCKIVGTYIDSGKTARKSLKSRTELARLLSDVEADRIDLIIFTKLDRWFRNIKDYYKVQEVLEAHKVNWKTIFESYDTTTANGRLYINIMLSLAQDEADRTSERIKAVFENKRAIGEATNSRAPIGYKVENSKILIDEQTAPVAREIFDYYYLNSSQWAVRNHLIEMFGVHLENITIKRILTNRLYIGEYHGIENFCEPLIDREKFDKIQAIVKERGIKSGASPYDFIFTGLITCAECGARMSGNAQRVKRADGTEAVRATYRCNNYYNGKHTCCNKRCVSETKIEEYLLENIMSELSDYVLNIEIKQKQRQKPKTDKAAVKRKLERLKELYINNLIDMDMYKKDYAALTALLAEDPAPSENIAPYKEFLRSDPLAAYTALDNPGKRTFWRSIISRLKISADKKFTIMFTN